MARARNVRSVRSRTGVPVYRDRFRTSSVDWVWSAAFARTAIWPLQSSGRRTVLLVGARQAVEGLAQESGVFGIEAKPGGRCLSVGNRLIGLREADILLDLRQERPGADAKDNVGVGLADRRAAGRGAGRCWRRPACGRSARRPTTGTGSHRRPVADGRPWRRCRGCPPGTGSQLRA